MVGVGDRLIDVPFTGPLSSCRRCIDKLFLDGVVVDTLKTYCMSEITLQRSKSAYEVGLTIPLSC